MAEENVIEEIQDEIKKMQGNIEDFEIEVVDDPAVEAAEEAADVAEEKASEKEFKEESDYGPKVQKRIQKIVSQRKEAETQARLLQEQNNQLQKRLERLEQGSQKTAEQNFNEQYQQTKQALHVAMEEGDTEAQVNYQERMADMRAAMRVAEMQQQQYQQRHQEYKQQQQRQQQQYRQQQQQAAHQETSREAISWWKDNEWFNSAGYERETQTARAIDEQLAKEGYDKESPEYFEVLNNRLQNVFPELGSKPSPSKSRTKSRSPVAPTTGGSSSYKGNRVKMSKDQLKMARELGINTEAGLKQYEAEIRQLRRSQ